MKELNNKQPLKLKALLVVHLAFLEVKVGAKSSLQIACDVAQLEMSKETVGIRYHNRRG